jgi:hypothetical protein
MSPSTGIKHYTYTDFNNNHIYNVNDITGINNIIGGSGIFSSARGSYNYLQASGGTYLRPTTASNRGIYIGQASSTSSGILMAASGDTTIDFQLLVLPTKDEYNMTIPQNHLICLPMHRQLLQCL